MISVKKRAELIATVFVLIAALASSSCSEDKASELTRRYFGALNSLDFRLAGELLGDENFYSNVTDSLQDDTLSYYEKIQYESFIKLVYENISVEILKSEERDEGYSVDIAVSSYAARDILSCHESLLDKFKQSEQYKQAAEANKYVLLCEYIPEMYESMKDILTKTQSKLNITITQNDNGDFLIKADKKLFDAIAGIKE